MKHLSALLASLAVAGCSVPKTEIRTNISINAPRELVWDILADFDKYPDWNPYHVKMVPDDKEAPNSPNAVGDEFRVFIHKPNDEKLDLGVEITVLKPGYELNWGGGFAAIFKGEHRFKLSEIAPDVTQLDHDEDFVGVFLPVIPLGPEYIEEGYNLMNEKMKERAEAFYSCKQNPGTC